MQPTDESKRSLSKASDYRTHFSNAFGLRFNDNDALIDFMIAADGNDVDSSEIQTSVIMTPRSMKVLGLLLIETIVNFEVQTGQEVPVKKEKHKKMMNALKEFAEMPEGD